MIQPLIKTLFGDSDTATDADAMENFLFHKVVCAGSADAQNILNLINRIGSLIKLNCVSSHGLMTILTAHKASSTGYILTNSDQNPLEPRTMQNHFKKVLKNSGITSANYHSLRHTFATRCIELGFDVKSLSEILGHASVNITMNRYVHPSMDLKRENMQRLSDLLAVK